MNNKFFAEKYSDRTENQFSSWLQRILPVIETGGGSTISLIAGEVINGGNAVIIENDSKIYKFDITNSLHAGKFAGVALNSVLSGNQCSVIVSGEMTNVGSGYSAGTVYYVAANSMLTSTAPAHGLIHKVGVGSGVDKILITSNLEFEIL